MTMTEIGERVGVAICTGGCGLSAAAHREGRVVMGVVHYAERRFSRRSARNLLLLITKMLREADDEYLNRIDLYDWFYAYSDARDAQQIARRLGFRIPAHLWNDRRDLCRVLAARRGVALSRYPKVYAWSRDR